MKTPPPSRLARLTKAALPVAPLALAAIPTAKGQIVYTYANVTLTASAANFIYADMGTGGSTGSAVLGNPADRFTSPLASPSFYLFFRGDNQNNPEWGSNSNTRFDGDNQLSGTGNMINKLAFGTVISGSITNLGNYAIFSGIYASGPSQWPAGTTGYFGLQFDTNTTTKYGWVQIAYNADKSMTLIDFAYEASGGSIAAGAGAIPEPSTSAALAGLLAGSAALYAKRRKSKVNLPATA